MGTHFIEAGYPLGKFQYQGQSMADETELRTQELGLCSKALY